MRKSTTLLALALLLGSLCIIFSSCGGESSSSGVTTTLTAPQNIHAYPSDITAAPDGSRLYVTNNVSNLVSILDPATLGHIADIPVTCAPRHLAVNDTNTMLYVSHDNTAGCTLSPLPQLDTDSGTGYAGTKLSLIDLSTNRVSKEIRLNGMVFGGKNRSVDAARGMVWDTATGVLYVAGLNSSSVTMIDTNLVSAAATQQVVFTPEAQGEVLGFVRDISMPVNVDLTTDKSMLVVPQTSDGKLTLIDTSTNLPFSGSPWTLTGCTNPNNALIYKAAGDPNSDKYVFISCNGSDKINIYDISNPTAGAATLLGSIPLGIQDDNFFSDKPTVMYLTPDGTTLLILNTASGTVQTVPWNLLKFGSGTAYGLLFPVRPTDPTDVKTFVSDMAVIDSMVYVTDMMANQIYKFDYKNTSLATHTLTYTPTDFASFLY